MSYFAKVTISNADAGTGAVEIVDYAHSEVHSGNHYIVRNTASLAKNGTKNILIITPNTSRLAHMLYGYEANDAAVVGQFFEAPTYSSAGTLDGARNRNRNFTDNNTTLVYNDPVITTTGLLITQKSVGSGRTSGGGFRENTEIVLKANTAYLLRIVEGNVLATNINWELDWYEHTNNV